MLSRQPATAAARIARVRPNEAAKLRSTMKPTAKGKPHIAARM